jgi:hypothetical protein
MRMPFSDRINLSFAPKNDAIRVGEEPIFRVQNRLRIGSGGRNRGDTI